MRGPKKERTFAFWLVVVQLAAVLPLLAFATLLTYRVVAKNEDDAIGQLQQKATVSANAIAREADRVRTRLELLAKQESAERGDVAAVRKLAVRLLEIDSSIAGASAFDRTGQFVFRDPSAGRSSVTPRSVTSGSGAGLRAR